MLDTATKRRIDTARDILVGKVPDPKSQVEQITIALIYKFMDDMDALSEELGGVRKFFADGYSQYGWAKLMRSGLGGHEALNLYAEAIAKMPENPGLPLLFRTIFKNAYLPYRDPETLRAFLKIIDEFEYDHSERLGDAYEYLLSVLGSQGDAGQFRTPRHIIDFLVAVVDPKKHEVIIDPAEGTAGFLISSYKHILRENTDSSGTCTLTPDEKARLAQNLRGYDISPDMVRLALVNMYLHGFTDPHIYEYDTLTSLERWNEHADVFMANPPFMSPKGGIRPHNRFTVQSKRSEVLFVNYMAEHLTPNGRAGIIVPEGIIFQSQNTYKQLRKMLVTESLVAVVSLPAGLFQPYSGVKTSILVLDKSLAKRSATLGFFKVDNDGYGLGAQRRPIDKNDLPLVLAEITEYLRRQRTGEALDDYQPTKGLIVERAKVAANGEYNLSGERYREVLASSSSFPIVTLGEVCDLYQPKTITQADLVADGQFLVFGANGVIGRYTQYNHEDVEVIVTCRGATCGTVNKSQPKSWITGNAMVVKPKNDRLTKDFLYYAIKNTDLKSTITGSAQPQITRQSLAPLKLPLPPLEVQKEIVAEIEGYQHVIDGARAVIDNYRPHIPIDPEWPMVELGEVVAINPRKSEVSDLPGDTVVSFVPMAHLGEHSIAFDPKESKTLSEVGASYTYFRDNDVLIAKVTPCFENGKAGIARHLSNGIGFGSSEFYVIRCSDKVLSEWAYLFVACPAFRTTATEKMTGTGGLQRVPRAVLERYPVPLPPLSTQQAIVAEIEAEQKLVDANRELISRMEKKIQAALARVWGEDGGVAEGSA
ncbi:MAG: restriction endonuclease subunit M/S [Desulfovibrionales bacterium]|nr:MAG: restriction endonuclease subunit M/S [Desulfovibrionales bacterium]